MSADQTHVFKALAKRLKLQNLKNLENEGHKTDEIVASRNYKLLIREAEKLKISIYDFWMNIMDKRRDYLMFNTPAINMYESERASFEKQCDQLFAVLLRAVKALSSQAKKEYMREDEGRHLILVCESLDSFLKKLAGIIAGMKSLRINFLHTTKPRIARLRGLAESFRETERDPTGFGLTNRKRKSLPSITSTKPLPEVAQVVKTINLIQDLNDQQECDVENDLNDDEKVQLIAENERMFEQFSRRHDDVLQLENQISTIQHLQETLTEKLQTQEQEIDNIEESALHTNMNLSDGNEWLRKTLASNAGRRVIMLFSLIVFSLTLLFIDWYNP